MISSEAAFLLVLQCVVVFAAMPLQDNVECTENFIDVNPLVIMETWKVIEHTDNLTPPSADCLYIKFGRRASFNSNFRMDIVGYFGEDSNMMADYPILRGDVAVAGRKPFTVSVAKMPKVFPPNIMLTAFDDENGCMAAWTCEDMKSASQKAAWIACKSNEVDAAVIDKLKQDLAQKADIDPSYFSPTQYAKCTF